MMGATAEQYAELFNAMGVLSHAGVAAYRTKTIRAGKMLEAECFPIYTRWADRSKLEAHKKTVPPEVMQEANERNSWKRMNRMVHANFGEEDYWCTLSYAESEVVTLEQARKDMRNYIARVQRARKRAGMEPTKYVYVIEWGETNGRIHHHIIMQRMDWDEVQRLWGKGRTEVKRLQEDERGGYRAMTRYMLKRNRPNGEGMRRKEKAWSASKGMKRPEERISDRKVSRRKVEKIARAMDGDESEARAIFERAYPGYKLASVNVKLCDFAPGAYIYATMYREEAKKHARRRGTGAGSPVPVGGIRKMEMARAYENASHPKRRKPEQGGGGAAQGAGRQGGRA